MIELILKLQIETEKLGGLADVSLAQQLEKIEEIKLIVAAIEEAAIIENLSEL